MAINWNNLRAWNGSQATSFEELCCQLAAAEAVPADSLFFRKGVPDAGVECFWRLANGDEWAWQAKFFRYVPRSTQWREIDESIANAIEKHLRLTKLTICLPIDRSDARTERYRSFSMKWNDHVSKWQRLAASKGASISFEYWGQSEIGTRLSNEQHRGRHWFWFYEDRFSNAWFMDRVEEALAGAGDRYSPELNIDLPIGRNFEGLGRTPAFFKRVEDLYSEAHIKFKKLSPCAEPESLKEKYTLILDNASALFFKIKQWIGKDVPYSEWGIIRPIPWNDIGLMANELNEIISNAIREINELKEKLGNSDKKISSLSVDYLEFQTYHLRDARDAIARISDFSYCSESRLSNIPHLLLVGSAGQGKTHLLCDVAKAETLNARPRLLFHGEHFHNDEPWSQMIRLLGLNCSREEFLVALEAAAQANNCRILILIDALNEGEGNRLWHRFLPGMLAVLTRTPWIGLCISVRTDYEEYIIPPGLDRMNVTRVEHIGFGNMSYEAATKFFATYDIEPSVPVLSPEFDNPLFLKLFCQSLKNARLTRIPLGLRGITSIFKFFIESIDKKLSRVEYLDYDIRSRTVAADAIELLAKEMAKGKTDRLRLDRAQEIINRLLPTRGHHNSLFRHLESENVLTVVPDYLRIKKGVLAESVRFTHQRFSDHIIAGQLLKRYFDRKDPKASFSSRSTLGRLLGDGRTLGANSGVLNALAIQVPELVRKELPDLALHLRDAYSMRKAFVDSLIWRDSTSFSRATDQYIDKHVLVYRDTLNNFLDAMLALASIPKHPFNADRLHAVLHRIDMPSRDAWWSVFLHNEWGQERSVDRLVKWAWEDSDRSRFDDEVIRLAGIALIWFFTSANRFLRDRATKAMVRLCDNRIHALRQIIEKAAEVNDPYVLERLYAVAYGCAMRTDDHEELGLLAKDVYRHVFENGRPPAHILLRDYARGVIEVALHRGVNLDAELAEIRPPYRSDWPAIEIIDTAQLETWGKWEENMPREHWAQVHLYSSVMSDEDFSRYVIGDLDEWLAERLGEPHKYTHRELYDQFVASLTARQRKALDFYEKTRMSIDFYERLDEKERGEKFKQQYTKEELDEALRDAEKRLLKTIAKGSRKSVLYRKSISEYIAHPHKYHKENLFDAQLARRWMMSRIIGMGWTIERFGQFDSYVNSYGGHHRAANKPERIGKKYQWIAYHELLARISDNFKMNSEKWSVNSNVYTGPWDLGFRRDIDPSNLQRKTEADERHPTSYPWWFSKRYDSWEEPIDELEWLNSDSELPLTTDLIEVTDPKDGSQWLTMNGFFRWEQPTPIGEEQYNIRRRDLWCKLSSYFLKSENLSELMQWVGKQARTDRWMPEVPQGSQDIFLGEYFWAPSFISQDCQYHGRPGWTRGDRNSMPTSILVAADAYFREASGFDCSIDETMNIDLPCRYLAEGMKLNWRGAEGHWYDTNRQLVACDPSVRCKGPSVLLVRREPLLEFLKRWKKTLIWILFGEKRVIGGLMAPDDHKGLLEIKGTYAIKRGKIVGATRTRFLAPGDQR